METVNQEQATAEQLERTFTQSEMDAIIGERLKREREKYSDYAQLKEKAEQYDQSIEAQKSDLEKANEKVADLQKQVAAYQKTESVRQARDKVSAETGIPVKLLTGETEDECNEQAKLLADYIKPSAYPAIKDAGEVRNTSNGSSAEQFADWFNAQMN